MLKRILVLVTISVLILLGGALAEDAKDITQDVSLDGSRRSRFSCMTDGQYKTYWHSGYSSNAPLTITAREGTLIGGVWIRFYDLKCDFALQVRNEQGSWQEAARCGHEYLSCFASLEVPAQSVRVVPVAGSKEMLIAQLRVFTPGTLPAWVQVWQPPLEKADILVLSTHPDDELLFFGGAIPYYASEYGAKVQVAYLVRTMPYRRLELLDGLWLCGVRNYPDIGPFQDRFSYSRKQILSDWGEARVARHVTGLFRRYCPEVVIAQDTAGEYGHGAHKVAAKMAVDCVRYAADPSYQKPKLQEKETWQVKKVYLHLYEDQSRRMNWRAPLASFDGKTAYDIACEAFRCHISQQHTDYAVLDSGDYDCSKFGLAFTAVGPDEAMDDFLEHTAAQHR